MAMQTVNASNEPLSVTLTVAEYEALLKYVPEDETAFLLREPNRSILLKRIDDYRHRRGIIERELLPDKD
jgi:hypothetical protein